MGKEFLITQTSLKDLEKPSTCPFRWKSQWLEGLVPFSSNESMDRGKYFEYLCIGGSAISNDEVTDLPRLKNGEKSLAQKRIEEQVEVFKELFINKDSDKYLGHEIIDIQVDVRNKERKGTVDFVTKDHQNNIWLFDLKLTADVDSTRSEYGWGHNWSDLDLVQLVHYRDLYYEQTGVMPRVGLAVFDYSPRKGIKINELVIDQDAVKRKEDRFGAALSVIEQYKQAGWTKCPSETECKNCPLICDKRFKQ